MQGGASDLAIVVDLVDQFFAATEYAAHGIGVTAEKLGGAV